MIPTVARIVHYYSEDDLSALNPLAAVITEVIGGNTVSLHVMYPRGYGSRREVDFSGEPKPGHWSWPW
jgi:hypothetical protein